MMCRRLAVSALCVLFGLTLYAQDAAPDLHWETPSVFSSRNGTFPVAVYSGSLAAVVWQETTPAPDGSGGTISVSLAVKEEGGTWTLRENVAAYEYSGEEPAILSASIDTGGRILIAAAASATETDLLISADRGLTFEHHPVTMDMESSVAPRIFTRADGGYLLFVTRGRGQSLTLYYARSDDGVTWSGFQSFVSDQASSFFPTHAAMDGRDYIVYQGQVSASDDIPTYQLFARSSDNGGRSWSSARRITTFLDPSRPQSRPEMYDNQRAHLSVLNIPGSDTEKPARQLFLVWERRYNNAAPQIFGMQLPANLQTAARAERINSEEAYCNNPVGFELNGAPAAVWFDNSLGGVRIILSRRGAAGWERGTDISGGVGGEAAFARPVITGDQIFIFWQAGRRIYALAPDTTITQPRLFARNFTLGRRSRNRLVQIGWNPPQDSSSVLGYSWSWSIDPNVEPPREIMAYSSQRTSDQNADHDGVWYFTLIAQDIAGNWSNPVRLAYIRDTTPPPAASILPPETDDGGFLLSNSFALRWNTPPASDIAGYTWNLEYLGPAGQIESSGEELNAAAEERFGTRIARPPQSILGPGNSVSFDNEDNGLFCFSVQAVDEVGNIGAAARYYFKTNKYIARTIITYVTADQTDQGNLRIDIFGRGFADGGGITRIIFDRDGVEPWDRELKLADDDYRIRSDREIADIIIPDLTEGRYRIMMDHPLRGRSVAPVLVTVDKTGMVKFGDFSREWQPSWAPRQAGKFVIDTPFLILAAVLVFCAILLLAAVRGLSAVASESHAIRLETIALLTGDIMPSEKKKRMTKIKRRGTGLALKMASFTIALVVLVVIMISAPLYVMMMGTQERTLLKGLWDRSAVLLEGIATSARPYMPNNNYLELSYLPSQSEVIPEAHYVTITGYGTGEDVFSDHVLATNDPDIASKIDTGELEVGTSRLADSLTPRTEGIADELDQRARLEVGELSAAITGLYREGMELVGRTDAASGERLNAIAATMQSLQGRVNDALTEIGYEIGSEPAFSVNSLRENENRTYIFFKPILYRSSDDDSFFRGLIRLEVGIDSIVDQIQAGRLALLRVIVIIALAAIAIGALGALLLSTLIIKPITRLVSHVERIRDTEDKSKLEGVDIEIKSTDEIAVLGNTINEMTHGLVKAAAAAADLSLGKEIQKKFIPLELNRAGDKLTSGYKDFKNVRFFGYYEGAKGVSGDYFDYQDLDERYFAIIKCDVAGKGIPAALIMIQVATMFISFFRRWKPDEKGLHIEDLVYQINDFLETLGFKGRFAAFTLALFDSQTGLVRFCNAGDNIIHLFDASEGRMKTISLRETPATGVLPNFLVESKGGYRVQTLTIDRGDILFLYTDGIEEAKRRFRNAEFKEIICEEGEKDTPHATHTVGQGDEEMGPDRVEGIINAVMNRQVYTLHKYHNPEGENHDLTFDFTGCEGKVEETVLAMVSVEKIFRMYKDPKAGDDARVLVDKRVDEFLKKHFLQYRTYCYDTKEASGNDAYLYYTRVREDDQYDDLTILGINRK